MKLNLILSFLLTCLWGCKDKNVKVGCDGPDRFIFKEAKAAFLESGFVLLETEQDSSYVEAKVPYVNCQPCNPGKLTSLKIQKDKGPVLFNYIITCGMKYEDLSIKYSYPPAPKIFIYSVKPL